MRISLSVNGASRFICSLPGPGYLSAHLSMSDNRDQDVLSREVHIKGYDTSSKTETVSLRWPTVDLDVGDVVELRILPEGEGTPPLQILKSSELPDNLFSSTELAKELLRVVSEFESRITHLLSRSEKTEPATEHKKFAIAATRVFDDLGRHFLYPIYRRHIALVPEALKGEPL